MLLSQAATSNSLCFMHLVVDFFCALSEIILAASMNLGSGFHLCHDFTNSSLAMLGASHGHKSVKLWLCVQG